MSGKRTKDIIKPRMLYTQADIDKIPDGVFAVWTRGWWYWEILDDKTKVTLDKHSSWLLVHQIHKQGLPR